MHWKKLLKQQAGSLNLGPPANHVDSESNIVQSNSKSPAITGKSQNIKSASSNGSNKKKMVVVNSLEVVNSLNRRFQCKYCGYWATRRHRVQVHVNQHCEVLKNELMQKVIKDKQCIFCRKFFTHDGLRSHLRNFIDAVKKNRKIRGVHRNFNTHQHEAVLDKIKFRK